MVSEGGRRTGGYSLDLPLLQMVHVDVYAIFAETAGLIHHGWSRVMSRKLNGSAGGGEKSKLQVDV